MLAAPACRVDRHPVLDVPEHAESVPFTFDGRPLVGHRTEMLSSALLANDLPVLGRHRRDGSPQGIFCANGQCSQCQVLVDGVAVKACLTPLRAGMVVRSLSGDPELKTDDAPVPPAGPIPQVATDVLIVGGGPAGLTAAVELAEHGVSVTICDDKASLGGKLALQTHNFFGSVRDCYAGTRGREIGVRLEQEVRRRPAIRVWTGTPVVGVFDDGWVGVVHDEAYTLVRPKAMLVATGAREKALAFPGSDLPGVYGAGAFQTLVNRDLVKPSRRLLVVGGGNVGLIVAYQALQAGIDVAALVEVLPECGGYKVHRDKILRLGIPVLTSHTVVRAQGTERVERVVVARVDEKFRPIAGTERSFAVDTILLAVGLSPVNELYAEARRTGLRAYSAGDAQEIAEASVAMFSGKIVAREILHDLGVPVEVPTEWIARREEMRRRPGPTLGSYPPPAPVGVYPILRCEQEIPCNPCTEVCPKDSIVIPEGTIVGRPKLVGDCVGCLKCLAVCPGLAISLVDHRPDPTGRRAKVTVPWEMPEGRLRAGDRVLTTGREGEPVGTATVVRILTGKALNRRQLVVLDVAGEDADHVAGIRFREPEAGSVPDALAPVRDEEIVVCRCERVSRAEIAAYITATGTRDLNAVKAALRCGMGPCGGRTCTELILRIFRELGVDLKTVTPPVHRPFTQEVAVRSFLVACDSGTGV
jgi:NADPH-dependent 2,4-dienoyl-CoA reductase/sulfur reductase-like enzyme/Fe-S-cluster-containing hydrogenase component 2